MRENHTENCLHDGKNAAVLIVVAFVMITGEYQREKSFEHMRFRFSFLVFLSGDESVLR